MENSLSIVNKYTEKYLGFDVNNIEFIGSGSSADVYGVGNVAIKVTNDRHDAEVSFSAAKGNFINLVKTHNVFKLPFTKKFGQQYIIVNERLTPIRIGGSDNHTIQKGYNSIAYLIDDTYSLNSYFTDEEEVEHRFSKKLKKALDRCEYATSKDRDNLHNSIPDFINMMKELVILDVKAIDFHAGNFGYDNKGTLKFLDLGYYSSKGINEEIQEIEL